MMLTPEQDNPDYKLLYQSLMKQKAELVEQHRLLGNHVKQQNLRIAELEKGAARYRWLRDHEDLESIEWPARDMARAMLVDSRKTDEAIDAAMQPTWPEDTSDYGSRIAIVGQNGNDGLAYQKEQP